MADTTVKVSFIGDAKKLKSTLDSVDKDIDDLGRSSKSFGSKFTDGFSKALPVLAGVGAGIAVLGSALKAAVEDEAEQKTLAETLRNVAGATTEQIKATEKWIDVTQRATGVTDSELRPALGLLTRETKDVGEAQKLMAIAMDVSQGTGKDLSVVATAMTKILEGNTAAANKLVPELSGIAREGASADEIMAALAATFKGQTTEHANTAAGKLERMNIAFDEMKERVGAALLPKLTEFGDWMLNTGIPKIEEMATDIQLWWDKQDGLKLAIHDTVAFLKDEVEGIKVLVGWIQGLISLVDSFQDKLGGKGPVAGIDELRRRALQNQTVVVPGGERLSTDAPPVVIGGENIPGFAQGGIVPGVGPKLAIVHGGEEIRNRSQQGGGIQVINLVVDGKVLASAVVNASNDVGGLPIRIRAAT